MKVKVSEATPKQLDWAVSKCEGVEFSLCAGFAGPGDWRSATRYSTDWAQGGPIVDREGISIQHRWVTSTQQAQWKAQVWDEEKLDSWFFNYGPTALIAAMRCYVASRLGDEVEVPDELMAA